jgi:catechol 2,3-dioxygenase-like lactoylglutathione lyase family enzyme
MRVVAVLLTLGLAAGLLQAQSSAPTGPEPTGLVVGSGNFFSPIVQDLDKAVAFYRDGIGFETQGQPANANENPALRNMFGLPDAHLRWTVARAPGMQSGVEIVEISAAGGKPLQRRMQDSGAFTLIVFVRDIDATLARVKSLGAPVISTGTVPATLPFGAGKTARMVMVQDPDGHFVELVQPEEMPASQAPAAANVVDVRVRLTVDDVDRSMQLYRDALGLKVVSAPALRDDATVSAALGVSGAQYRAGIMQVPTSGLTFEVIDFKGIDHRAVRGRLQDPGSTRIQFRVRDVDAAVAAFEKFGAEVVSAGGAPLELPVPGGSLKVAIVREPDNLFVVLIQAPPPK